MLIEGVIASAPDADRRVTVTIPTFHPEQTFGPCPYMPRGGALPTVGARCLVALDETGVQEPWVPAWDGPDDASGGSYIPTSEKGAASGVATLDGNTRVPNAQLGSAMPDATTFLRGDRTWAAPPGGSASSGSVTYGTGYSAYGPGIHLTKFPGGLVVVNGGVGKSSAPASGDVIFTLPTGFQPVVDDEYALWMGSSNPGASWAIERCDLYASTGQLQMSGAGSIVTGGSSPWFLFMSGMTFSTV